MADWKFGRRRDACAGCETPFEDGAPHFSVLRVAEGGLVRDDVCPSCFATGGEGSGANDLTWWRTKKRAKQTKGPRLDLESVENLFIALEEREEQKLRELRYLLCLVLMRKRRLKIVRVLRLPEGEAFSVKRPRQDEELLVYVYELTPERQTELKAELVHLFDDPSLAAAAEAAASEDTASEEAGSEGPGGQEDTVAAEQAEQAPSEPAGAGDSGERD